MMLPRAGGEGNSALVALRSNGTRRVIDRLVYDCASSSLPIIDRGAKRRASAQWVCSLLESIASSMHPASRVVASRFTVTPALGWRPDQPLILSRRAARHP